MLSRRMQKSMRRLRNELGIVAATLLIALAPLLLRAQDSAAEAATDPTSDKQAALSAELMTPARPAIEKGLKFLATQQQEDGAFSASGYGRNAAVVALAAWPGSRRALRRIAGR